MSSHKSITQYHSVTGYMVSGYVGALIMPFSGEIRLGCSARFVQKGASKSKISPLVHGAHISMSSGPVKEVGWVDRGRFGGELWTEVSKVLSMMVLIVSVASKINA